MQRFQGLDRHRPCGALPEVAGTSPFLPPFVGMTPLATDGPGSGSGAGFGRDHAEKWRSGGVSRTTSVVTNVTDSVSLNPLSTRTCVPSPRQILPAQAPSSSASTAPQTFAYPAQDTHLPVPDPPEGGAPPPPTQNTYNEADHVIRILSTGPEQTLIVDPLIRGRLDSRRDPSAYDSKATSWIPLCAAPAPTNKIVARDPHPHQRNQETPRSPQLDRVPFTPYVIASLLREPATDARSHGEQVPFSRETSTVLASVARPGQRACGRPPPDSRQDPRPPS